MSLAETVRQSARRIAFEGLGVQEPAAPTGEAVPQDEVTTVRSTGRWRGVVAVSLCAMAVGMLAARPSLLLVAAVGVVFAAYPQLTSQPDPEIAVSRELTAESDGEMELMAVETTVENRGDSRLFDLRIVDGVPPLLAVVDGSARCATTLGAGEAVTLSYRLALRPGRHRFRSTTALCRDTSGALEVETEVTEPTEIESAARVPTIPLAGRHPHRSGPLPADESGDGIEFHSVEQYTRGDPASRIDWRRFARSRELRSVAYRPERLAEVIICVDARAVSYRASGDGEPHAVALAVEAAGRIAETLFESTHRVGLAGFGRKSCLLSPGSGSEHRSRLHRRLSTDPAFSFDPPTDSGELAGETPDTSAIENQLSRLRHEIGPNTQLLLLTPLCDHESTAIAQGFATDGAAVTVISPDVTTDATDGSRVARLERELRLTALRNVGVPTVDWDPNEPLGAALASLGGHVR